MVLSEHGGIEGIFDMLYPEIVFTANGGHDVETDRQVYIEVFDVGIGSHDNMAHFFPIDCILRCNASAGSAGLYLHDYQFVVFGGYDVQFQMVLVPVTVQDGVTVCCQMGGSGIFTSLA